MPTGGKRISDHTTSAGLDRMLSIVSVERRAAAQTQPKLLDSDSSFWHVSHVLHALK
jgi:hypothetical protein